MSLDVKLFADDTSLFFVIHDINTLGTKLNGLSVIKNWAFRWKMSFNLDCSKQAQEVTFSRKKKNVDHSPLIFNSSADTQTESQKLLGVILDSRLTFEINIYTAS